MNRRSLATVAVLACTTFGAGAYGCSSDDRTTATEVGDGGGTKTHAARAALEPTGFADAGMPRGSVDLVEADGKVTVTIEIAGATPGTHGMHIHANASCDANDAGAAGAAGGHWNPADASHGSPSSASHHPGDFGNIEIGAGGTGSLTLTTSGFSVDPASPSSALNHAVVFHAGTDDVTTQPTGNSGGRAACGLIVAK